MHSLKLVAIHFQLSFAVKYLRQSMSIEIFMNGVEKNAINFRWSLWPTNIFALWSPEVYIFENDADRFWVRENIGWHMEDGALVSPQLEVAYHDYAFVWKASLTPVENAVDILYELTNTGDRALPEMVSS